MFLVGAALAANALGNPDRAADTVREARQLVDASGMAHLSPVVGLAEGITVAAKGQDESAVQLLLSAEASALSLGLRPVVWQARAASARALARLGRKRESSEKQAAARTIIEEIGALFQDQTLRSGYLEATLPLA
jgi:hypothetical protein